MDLRQNLRQIAVALVGDDDAGAGLGDQEIGAGDADIGGEEFRPQDLARLVGEGARLLEVARRVEIGVRRAEGVGDLFLEEVDGRRDDMARRLVAELNDVFAEIGLDRRDRVGFEEIVERDLLGDHRLAFGHRLGVDAAADRQDGLARLVRRPAPMHLAAALDHVPLEFLEIEVEMRQRMILDALAFLAQRLELGQPLDRRQALQREAGLGHAERGLQRRVGKGLARVALEGVAGRIHRLAIRPGGADRRDLVGHAGEHFGDVADAHRGAAP